MITVAYIAAPSEAGQELCEMVIPALEKVVREKCCEEIDWFVINNPRYPDGLGSNLSNRQLMAFDCCYGADLVIFDGSIDIDDKNADGVDTCKCFKIENSSDIYDYDAVIRALGGYKNALPAAMIMAKRAMDAINGVETVSDTKSGTVCSQYEYAYQPMIHQRHVLIVSRTKLPYNFESFYDKGGAPSWLRSHIVTDSGEIKKESFKRSPDDLVKWIITTAQKLELPRKDKLIPQNIEDFQNILLAEKQQLASEEKHDIFVSYLSKESRFRNNPAPIEEFLLKQATSISKEMSASFIYAPPGDLSNEIMTEQRRWELVSLIDRQMHRCKAVLLYMTDGYLRSWWTFAELMCLAYRVHYTDDEWSDGWNPIIYVVSQDKSITKLTTQEEMEAFLPKLSEQQCREIARRLSNSDPFEVAYELNETVGFAEMPENIKEVMIEFNVNVFGEENREQIKESLNSSVQTRSFRNKFIVDCRERSEYIQNNYTVDDFIELARSHKVEPFSIDRGRVDISSCGHSVKIKDGDTYYRFLQPRFGKCLNSEGWIVKPIKPVEVAEVAI